MRECVRVVVGVLVAVVMVAVALVVVFVISYHPVGHLAIISSIFIILTAVAVVVVVAVAAVVALAVVICFWAAAPKGTKSCRTQGDFGLFVYPSIHPSVHPSRRFVNPRQ